jgi:AraC family transcriptional regulator
MITNQSSSNYVLHAASKQFYWEGYGQLSIKTFAHGQAHYHTSKGFMTVRESSYLLLNEGPYTLSIDQQQEIESFCLFFKTGFAEQVWRPFTESTDQLLTDPYREGQPIGFFEKTYRTSHTLNHQLQAFKRQHVLFANDSAGCNELFHTIMHTILLEQNATLAKIDSLPAIRRSTREELYRRIDIAYEYIRCCYTENLQLDAIARVACMSPNHLLRAFAQLYNQTPHQLITALRISQAKDLLAMPEWSVTAIGYEVGFHSPAAFSKLFKQHTGLSPLQFRKKVILDKKFAT